MHLERKKSIKRQNYILYSLRLMKFFETLIVKTVGISFLFPRILSPTINLGRHSANKQHPTLGI